MPHLAAQLPHDIAQARSAALGLAALLSTTDERAWASMGRPGANQLAQLVFLITGRLDRGLEDLGFSPEDAPPSSALS